MYYIIDNAEEDECASEGMKRRPYFSSIYTDRPKQNTLFNLEIMEHEFLMSRDSTVGDVRRLLEEKYPEVHFSLNNQLLELEDDDILGHVIDDDDMITAIRHDPRKADRYTKADVRNETESIVVIINKRNNKPVIMEANSTNIVNLSKIALMRTITVFR